MVELDVTERGNVALYRDNSEILWVLSGDRAILEVSINSHNYPAWGVKEIDISVEDLAIHINANLQGWFIRKSNIEGLNVSEQNRII